MSNLSFVLGVVAWAVSASQAFAAGGEVDLGTNGTYRGYSSTSYNENGVELKQVRAYDMVCPGDSVRPSSGVTEIAISANQCISKSTGALADVQSSNDCFPIRTVLNTSDGMPSYFTDLPLGTYQCFSMSSMSIMTMDKVYRSESYIVAADQEGAQSSFSHGVEAAARAAGNTAGGVFSSCTANPFALCSGGRPGPKDVMRGCFDFLCKF